jgi:hypothetical protein
VLRTVKLWQPLSRIEGAKMWRGQLWASADLSGNQLVWTIDPNTGATAYQFKPDVRPDDEAEGLVALDLGPSGAPASSTSVPDGSPSSCTSSTMPEAES